ACRAGNGRRRVNGNYIIKGRPGASVGGRGDHISNRNRRRGGVCQTLSNGTAGLPGNRCIADACDSRPSPGKRCTGYIAGNSVVLRSGVTNGSTCSTGNGGGRVNGNHIIKRRPGDPVGCRNDDIGTATGAEVVFTKLSVMVLLAWLLTAALL